MIDSQLRQFVEQSFPNDPEFCKDVLLALKHGQNVVFLGQNQNRPPGEIMALKKIQETFPSFDCDLPVSHGVVGVVEDGGVGGVA